MENLSECDCHCDCDCDCHCDGGKTKSTPSLLALGLGWSLTKKKFSSKSHGMARKLKKNKNAKPSNRRDLQEINELCDLHNLWDGQDLHELLAQLQIITLWMHITLLHF